ncbi:MAG: hypothetical protein QNK36_15100 [Colwellia sp.]|nr:hypothetical protein [Colwellia sp.]
MKIAHKIYSETKGVEHYDNIVNRLHTISHTSITLDDRQTKIVFDDKSSLMLEDRGYEKAVLLSLFG